MPPNFHLYYFSTNFRLLSMFFRFRMLVGSLRLDDGGSHVNENAVTNGIMWYCSTNETDISMWPDSTHAICWCKQWQTLIVITISHTSHLLPIRPSAITQRAWGEKLASMHQVSRPSIPFITSKKPTSFILMFPLRTTHWSVLYSLHPARAHVWLFVSSASVLFGGDTHNNHK